MKLNKSFCWTFSTTFAIQILIIKYRVSVSIDALFYSGSAPLYFFFISAIFMPAVGSIGFSRDVARASWRISSAAWPPSAWDRIGPRQPWPPRRVPERKHVMFTGLVLESGKLLGAPKPSGQGGVRLVIGLSEELVAV